MTKPDSGAVQTNLIHEHDNPKLGIWLFLGGEIVFFSTLILTFGMIRFQSEAQYPAFRQHLSIPLIGINTFILIASSYLVVRALSAIQHGSRSGMRNNLIGVIILGALFISGQAYEWITLFRDGITVQDLFAGPFLTITGIHGTHVFIGLIWATIVLIGCIRGNYTKENYLDMENFGLFWHFVDIVWIILFTLIYLM